MQPVIAKKSLRAQSFLSGTFPRLATFFLTVVFGCTLSGIFLRPAIASDPPRRLAFIVGIDEYDNLGDQKQLTRAVRDADDVGSKLKGLGFDVVNDVGKNLGRDGFRKKWNDFLAEVDPQRNDTVAIFLSGHGVDIEGESFFLPKNIPFIQAGRQEQTKREGISLREMIIDLEARKPRIVLMLVDACRTNPFIPREYLGKGLGGTSFTGDGVLIVYSAGGSETALDRLPSSAPDPDPNSVFTRALLPMLDELKVSPEPLYRAWFQTLRNKVHKIAESAHREQSPKAYSGLEGDFCLLSNCADDATVLPNLENNPGWYEILNSTDEQQLLNYVGKYRGSPSAHAAQNRLNDLVRLRSTLHVISIGVGRHADPRLPILRFSGSDARYVSEAIQTHSASRYKNANVNTLIDGDATRSAIMNSFDQVRSSAQPNDTLVVYLSGHMIAGNEHAYLVPADGAIDRQETLINLADLSQIMSLTFGRVLFFVDGCGVQFTQPLTSAVLDKGRDNQLTVFAATAPDGIAFEILPQRHSAFAIALFEGLSGHTASGFLRQTMTTTIKELKDFISFRVDQITDGRQKPYFITSEDNFVLAQHPLPIAIDKGVQK